jgi:hypothetical protein
MQADKGSLAGPTGPDRVEVDSRRAVSVQDLLYGRFSLWAERFIE